MDNHTDNHATYHMVKNGFWKDPNVSVSQCDDSLTGCLGHTHEELSGSATL